mmetsp:Transcript_42618/g.93150  ORF Transcript_42618/g.93150 Transcript_42618/m.93150 type:complete len:214 (-) Transcript_42618:860-1501(-)
MPRASPRAAPVPAGAVPGVPSLAAWHQTAPGSAPSTAVCALSATPAPPQPPSGAPRCDLSSPKWRRPESIRHAAQRQRRLELRRLTVMQHAASAGYEADPWQREIGLRQSCWLGASPAPLVLLPPAANNRAWPAPRPPPPIRHALPRSAARPPGVTLSRRRAQRPGAEHGAPAASAPFRPTCRPVAAGGRLRCCRRRAASMARLAAVGRPPHR